MGSFFKPSTQTNTSRPPPISNEYNAIWVTLSAESSLILEESKVFFFLRKGHCSKDLTFRKSDAVNQTYLTWTVLLCHGEWISNVLCISKKNLFYFYRWVTITDIQYIQSADIRYGTGTFVNNVVCVWPGHSWHGNQVNPTCETITGIRCMEGPWAHPQLRVMTLTMSQVISILNSPFLTSLHSGFVHLHWDHGSEWLHKHFHKKLNFVNGPLFIAWDNLLLVPVVAGFLLPLCHKTSLGRNPT